MKRLFCALAALVVTVVAVGLAQTPDPGRGGVWVSGASVPPSGVDPPSGYVGQTSITTLGTITTGTWNGTAITVPYGGTGQSTFTDGGVLLGNGTGGLQAMAVLADGAMIVGDGTTDPTPESGATLRTSIGVGTGDSPTFTAVTVGQADVTAEGDLRLQDNTGGQYVALDAPGTVSSSYTLTLPAAVGAVDEVLSLSNTDGTLQWAAASSGGTPGGSNTQVQFNNSGSFGGTSGLTFVTASNTLAVTGEAHTGAGSVSSPGFAFGSDTDTGLFLPAANALGVVTAGAERLRVDASGKTLVGTVPDSLNGLLTVGSDTFPQLVVSRASSGEPYSATEIGINFEAASGTVRSQIYYDDDLGYDVNGSLILATFINSGSCGVLAGCSLTISDGHVGIGTNEPNLTGASKALTLQGDTEPIFEIVGSRDTQGTIGDIYFINRISTTNYTLGSIGSYRNVAAAADDDTGQLIFTTYTDGNSGQVFQLGTHSVQSVMPHRMTAANESGLHLDARDFTLSIGRAGETQENDPRIQFYSAGRCDGDGNNCRTGTSASDLTQPTDWYYRGTGAYTPRWDSALVAPGRSFAGVGNGQLRLLGRNFMIRGPSENIANITDGTGSGNRFIVFQSCANADCGSADVDRTSFIVHFEGGDLGWGVDDVKMNPEDVMEDVKMRLTQDAYLIPTDDDGDGCSDTTNGCGYLGTSPHKWHQVNAVAVNTGDLIFENGFAWTESKYLGEGFPPGMGLVVDREEGSELVLFVEDDGTLYTGDVKSLSDLAGNVHVPSLEERLDR